MQMIFLLWVIKILIISKLSVVYRIRHSSDDLGIPCIVYVYSLSHGLFLCEVELQYLGD